jgi:hypothetical protein
MTKPGKSKQKLEQPQEPAKPAQDVPSTRAKNTAHKKVTADKWNQ